MVSLRYHPRRVRPPATRPTSLEGRAADGVDGGHRQALVLVEHAAVPVGDAIAARPGWHTPTARAVAHALELREARVHAGVAAPGDPAEGGPLGAPEA